MDNYLQQLFSYFRNLVLNSSGAKRDLYQLIEDNDISAAIEMMQNRDTEVDKAIEEYNHQTHKVMLRQDKRGKSAQDDYHTEKLPRTRQRYINEVELFFLLGNPIRWKKKDGDDECFDLFMRFLSDQRFDSKMRQVKRLAGSETESAKLYHIYREGDERKVNTVVLARSRGYALRPMFDQYGNMTALAYGYKLKEKGRTVRHWDIQTADMLVYAKKGNIGWEVERYPNPTGKINAIYYKQPKAWDGAERRIEREEMLDSKIADTNNYFADPIAAATADVIDGMLDPEKPGKMIQLTGDGSSFSYINPPQSSETRRDEMTNLESSILFDTFTPDFSFDNLKGMGSLSGTAIKNAMILGFIKRDNRKEVYEELVDRERSVIISILKFLHPDKAKAFDELRIEFEFSEPFGEDRQQNWQAISGLYSSKLLSLEQAVQMLALTDAPEEEIERIKSSQQVANPVENQEKPEKQGEGI